MGKTFGSIFLLALVFLALCLTAFAAQPVLDKPAAPALAAQVNAMDETVIIISFPVPQSIRNFKAEVENQPGAPNVLIEFDTRMDGGEWFFDRKAGGERKSPLQEELLNQFKYRFLVYDPGASLKDMPKYESEFEAFMFGFEPWNLDKHSVSFRYRYVYEQLVSGGDGPVWQDTASPWSDEVSVGKDS